MIIGNGLLVDAFRGYATNNTVCIFTSGISDSLCKDTKIFQNEQDLLIDTLRNNTDKLCVFLSSCSIYDTTLADSDYVKHTLKMEDYIQRSGNRFLILRKPNLVGKRQENSSTIINYLARKIQNNEEFVVWSEAKRNFLDIEDFLKVATYLIDNQIFNNTSINIANTKNSDILEVVELLEDALGKTARYQIKTGGGWPTIDLSQIQEIIIECGIGFNEDYLSNLIRKYYQV